MPTIYVLMVKQFQSSHGHVMWLLEDCPVWQVNNRVWLRLRQFEMSWLCVPANGSLRVWANSECQLMAFVSLKQLWMPFSFKSRLSWVSGISYIYADSKKDQNCAIGICRMTQIELAVTKPPWDFRCNGNWNGSQTPFFSFFLHPYNTARWAAASVWKLKNILCKLTTCTIGTVAHFWRGSMRLTCLTRPVGTLYISGDCFNPAISDRNCVTDRRQTVG
jgi:hypothetical protein